MRRWTFLYTGKRKRKVYLIKKILTSKCDISLKQEMVMLKAHFRMIQYPSSNKIKNNIYKKKLSELLKNEAETGNKTILVLIV